MYVLFLNDCLNCLVNLRPCLPNNEEILQQANQGRPRFNMKMNIEY